MTLTELILRETPLTAAETRKMTTLVKKEIVELISGGGSMEDMPLGSGQLPNPLTVKGWEGTDSAFQVNLTLAKKARLSALEEELYRLTAQHTKSGDPVDKARADTVRNSLHTFQKSDENKDAVVNITFVHSIDDMFEED